MATYTRTIAELRSKKGDFEMKRVGYILGVFSLVFSCFPFISATSVVPPESGRLILRLIYKGHIERGRETSNPYEVAIFVDEVGSLQFPQLAATDWEGNIYIIHPYSPLFSDGVLKVFGKDGRFKKLWRSIPMVTTSGRSLVAVSRDRYVWVALSGSQIEEKGLPILIYHLDSEEKIFDFRLSLPKDFAEKIRQALNQAGLSKVGPPWEPSLLNSGGRQILVHLYDKLNNVLARHNMLLSVCFSSDGRRLVSAKVVKQWGEEACVLSEDGRWWVIKYDYKRRGKWIIGFNKIWMWERGKEEQSKKPLIDFLRNREPWMDKVPLKGAELADLIIGPNGTVYLDGLGVQKGKG